MVKCIIDLAPKLGRQERHRSKPEILDTAGILIETETVSLASPDPAHILPTMRKISPCFRLFKNGQNRAMKMPENP